MELRDDELDVVTGGIEKKRVSKVPQVMQIACICGCINSVDISKNEYICKNCGKKTAICG